MNNPLLSDSFEIPFDQVRGEHVEPAFDALLPEAQAKLDAMGAPNTPRTYENTLRALELVTEKIERAMAIASHMESVATTPELRGALERAQPKVSAFAASVALHEGAYRAVKEFAATAEAKALTGARARFLKKTLEDFRRAGAELDAKGKARLQAIDVELGQLTLKFGQNVLDATNAFEIVIEDEARLSGLPESAKAAAKASAASKGLSGWRFTLQAPSFVPVMTYADDAALREAIFRASNTRATKGAHDNRPVLRKILELRREKANLLGFATFADLVLEDRMAKRGADARKFVADLRDKSAAHFAREAAELAQFKQSVDGSGELRAWDVAYFSEKLRRARYDFDEEILRPYFSADAVLRGVFATAERLYGVRVVPADLPVWHESVRAFTLVEADGKESASFYVDLFPRETKRDGAWMHGILTGERSANQREKHMETIVANVTPPIGDEPALLNHREVETIFHEFGHLLHHASSDVAVKSLAGTNVAWDFVELPSQIMENWCWEREALDLFARHVKTNETIPDELLAKMRAARSFRAATQMFRQLGFAEVDLALHIDFDPKSDADPIAFARDIYAKHAPAPLPDDYAMIASFTHLFADPVGYAAGYYSYKWAEVLDADAFSRFKKEGIFSREVGSAFRRSILARGNSEDPSVLYREFMGRDPTVQALLDRDGLLE